MKPLRDERKDEKDEELRKFVNRFLKLIDEKRDDIAKRIEEERPRIREMSTMKPLDGLRKMTI